MRRLQPSTAWLLALVLSGCGSCQHADEGAGRAPDAGTEIKAGQPGGTSATSAGRIGLATAGRAAEFATPVPRAAVEAPSDEPTIAEPMVQGDCVVIIDADPDFGEPPLTVNFSVEAQCTGGTPTYTWDFGDNSPPSTEPAPVHTYAKAGEYTVTLKAMAPDGTPASDDIAITVEEAQDQ